MEHRRFITINCQSLFHTEELFDLFWMPFGILVTGKPHYTVGDKVVCYLHVEVLPVPPALMPLY